MSILFKQKRTISLLLAILLTAGVILVTASCANAGDGAKESDSSLPQASETVPVTETETVAAYESVEKQVFDRSFVMAAQRGRLPYLYVEGITGDILNDDIFERNTQVCHDFGVTMEPITYDDGYSVAMALQGQVNASLDDFDAYFSNQNAFSTCVTKNYCMNLATVASLAIDQTWWDQACRKNLSVDGKTYILNGDINPYSMIMSSAVVFNKNLMEDLGKSVTDLTSAAQNGKWTLDMLLEYTHDVTADLNGDGQMDMENDRYGLSAWASDATFSLFYGAGGMFVETVNGTPELTYSVEDITNVYEKIFKVIVTERANYVTDVTYHNDVFGIFADGRALFCEATLGKVNILISGHTDDFYGILPTPKYDENQEDYCAFINGATDLIMLAKNESDTEFAGTVLEAMATYSYDNVTPDLFEVVTKLQTAQDPESAAMVDVILRNRVYDLAYFGDFSIALVVWNHLGSKKPEISSALKVNGRRAQTQLANLIQSFDKCD